MKKGHKLIRNVLIFAIIILGVAIFSDSVLTADRQNNIESYQSVFIDEGKTLTIDDFTHNLSNFSFTPYKESGASSSMDNATYWVHIPIQDLDLGQSQYLLEVAKPHLSNIHFYQLDENHKIIQSMKTGRNLPFSTRGIRYKNFVFSLAKGVDTGYILLEIDTESYLQAPSRLWRYDEFIEVSNERSLVYGIFYGALLIMIVYNGFLAVSLRDLKYLFYVLFVISFLLLQFLWDGYSYQYLWRDMSRVDTLANAFLIAQSALWLMAFNWAFFEIPTRSRYLRIAYKIMFITTVVVGLLTLLIPMSLAIYSAVTMAIIALAFSVVSFILSKPKNRSHHLYIIAWSAFFYMSIISALGGFHILPYSILAVHGMKFGIVILIVLFSMALSNKIKEIEQLRIVEVERGTVLRTLHTISMKTTSIRDLDELYANLLHDFTSFTGFAHMLIALEMEENTLDITDSTRGNRILIDEEVYQSYIAAPSTMVSAPQEQLLKKLGMPVGGSNLLIPLTSKNKRLGFILLYAKNMVEPSSQVKDLLMDYAYQIALTIENIELVQELTEAAEIDSLTRLYNRNTFFEKAQELFAKDQMHIVMMDLDYFKRINDDYGHVAGDKVIREVTRRLRQTLLPKALLGRYGGEEFIAATSGLNNDEVQRLIDRFLKLIASTPIEIGQGEKINITISAGIASKEKGHSSLDELIEHADDLLYMAKEAGRNCITTSWEEGQG